MFFKVGDFVRILKRDIEKVNAQSNKYRTSIEKSRKAISGPSEIEPRALGSAPRVLGIGPARIPPHEC